MKKQKIVIVGAGPAGLSTAFFLTDPATSPDWKDRYEVDIYQLGWRVGGKGATGRNPDACERLQEHGIHVFGNMYFNTLRMMDQIGKVVHESIIPQGTSGKTVSTRDMAEGVYVLQIDSGNGSIVRAKVMVVHTQ